jgi:hypothetical protein
LREALGDEFVEQTESYGPRSLIGRSNGDSSKRRRKALFSGGTDAEIDAPHAHAHRDPRSSGDRHVGYGNAEDGDLDPDSDDEEVCNAAGEGWQDCDGVGDEEAAKLPPEPKDLSGYKTSERFGEGLPDSGEELAKQFAKACESGGWEASAGSEDNPEVDPKLLNERQRLVFACVVERLILVREAQLAQTPPPPPLRLVVCGAGGTGKSFVAKCVKWATRALHGPDSEMCAAMTGTAARLLGDGVTMHSAWKLHYHDDRHAEVKSLEGKPLTEMVAAHENLKTVQIDERSLVGLRTMGVWMSRLREARPGEHGSTVGDAEVPAIVMYGDDAQLGPVGDTRAWEMPKGKGKSTQPSGVSLLGKLFAKEFEHNVVVLEQQERQCGDDDDSQFLRGLLGRLRDGAATMEDAEKLNERALRRLPKDEQARFRGGRTVCLCSTNAHRSIYNVRQLKENKRPPFRFRAVDAGHCAVKEKHAFQGLPKTAVLAVGARVKVTQNLAAGQVTNGSLGTIVDILFDEGKRTPFPDAVLVELDDDVPKELCVAPELSRRVIAVGARTSGCRCRPGCASNRTQLPLDCAFALTTHGAQGMTIGKGKAIERALLWLGGEAFEKKQGGSVSYVQLSRVKELLDFALYDPDTSDDFIDARRLTCLSECQKIKNRVVVDKRRQAQSDVLAAAYENATCDAGFSDLLAYVNMAASEDSTPSAEEKAKATRAVERAKKREVDVQAQEARAHAAEQLSLLQAKAAARAATKTPARKPKRPFKGPPAKGAANKRKPAANKRKLGDDDENWEPGAGTKAGKARKAAAAPPSGLSSVLKRPAPNGATPASGAAAAAKKQKANAGANHHSLLDSTLNSLNRLGVPYLGTPRVDLSRPKWAEGLEVRLHIVDHFGGVSQQLAEHYASTGYNVTHWIHGMDKDVQHQFSNTCGFVAAHTVAMFYKARAADGAWPEGNNDAVATAVWQKGNKHLGLDNTNGTMFLAAEQVLSAIQLYGRPQLNLSEAQLTYPMSLDHGMLAIAERMREVAAGGPATIEHCYVFNDLDSSKTGHHWFTVCLSVTRVGENENVPSPEKHSPKTISLDLSPEKQSPKKRALMERSPERPRRRRIIHDAEMDT